MNIDPSIIKGGNHKDYRGEIHFMNNFDMTDIKRFYIIQNKDTSTIRAWRGHKIEQRWFYTLEGEFSIRLVKIDNWLKPERNLPMQVFTLTGGDDQVLHIPKGYASWIQATLDNSRLLVYADYGIDHAKDDDFLFPENYFLNTP